MQLQGALVRDIARVPVGRVRDVLVDPQTLDARWLQVVKDDDTTVLVPAVAASEVAAGELLVPYSSETISSAVHADGRALNEADAATLKQLYGFPA